MIRNIELVDFLAHSNTKLEFENDATVFVGDNGSGKSSIIDAITFSLFGEHTRKNNKGLIRRGANQGFAKIEFSANGKNYQAIRKIDSKGTLTAQFAENVNGKLILIAEACAVELDSYSRLIGRSKNNRVSLSSVALLPSDLIDLINNPSFNSLKQWLSVQLVKSKGMISIDALFKKLGEERPLKINKKESEFIVAIIEKTGFGMAPDIRFHHAKPDVNENIVIFETGHGDDFIPSHSFNQIGTILRLGSIVAKIDGHVDSAEVSFLENLINNDGQLNQTEKLSLNAFLHWQLSATLSVTGLKAKLSTITDREKTAISHVLIGVALADGKIELSEIKKLEKLYSSLWLDKSLVSNDIHHFSSNNGGNQPFGISKVIRDDNNELETQNSLGFSINKELLQLYEEETAGVKGILESIFVDEENNIDDISQDETSSEIEYDDCIGLNENHFNLFQKLIIKEEWSLKEVQLICKELNLMIDGALEEINEWAFDKVDAPIIEDGNTISIDLELVKEITYL
mgnify:CR=1 FL=1